MKYDIDSLENGLQFLIKLDTFTTWTTNLNSRCFSKRNEKPCLHKDLSTNIHSNFIHSCPKQETTQLLLPSFRQIG